MANDTTLIGKGIRIQGEITGQAPIDVVGTLEGTAGTEGEFRVLDGGQVIGEVAARDILVDGSVEGQLTAENKVQLHASCRVEGDIQAKSVAISEGAFFEGTVKMPGRAKP